MNQIEPIKHTFRNNLFSDWQEIMIDKDVLSLSKNKIVTYSIPLNEIETVTIIKSIGHSFACVIKGANNITIKFHSGAIKKFASPYQNLPSFSQIINSLISNRGKTYTFIIGSNKLYYFSLVMSIISVPITLFVLYIAVIKKNLPEYIKWKLFIMLSIIMIFVVPIIKKGKAENFKELNKLPYDLEKFI